MQVLPLPSGPHLPSVLTFVGTAGGGERLGVGVGIGVGVGVGVGVGMTDEVRIEELGTGTGTEDEGRGGEPPLQVPKANRQPVPQKSMLFPQK